MTTADKEQFSCEELVELVTDYLEDKMTPEDRSRFDEHLNWCPPCVEYLRQMRGTLRLAGKLAQKDIPETAKEGLLHAFRHWKGSAH